MILNHSGPWPGAVHDLDMLRQSGILDSLGTEEALLGDKGYRGETQLITPFSSPVSIGKIRVTVEHAFSRVKKFHCFRQQWRHSLIRHCMAFHVICEAVNCNTL